MKERIGYIDLAKGLCIVCIVIFHTSYHIPWLYQLSTVLLSFTMPLFVFVAGCFIKPEVGFTSFLKGKAGRLLLPFVFFYLSFSCLLPRLLYDLAGVNWTRLQYSEFRTAFLRRDYPCVPIWFLLSLFIIDLLAYPLLRYARKVRYSSAFIWGITIVLAFVEHKYHSSIHYLLSYSFKTLPFFVAGYYAYQKKPVLTVDRYDRFLPLLTFAAFGLFYVLTIYEIPFWWSNYIYVSTGIIGVLALSKWIGHLPYFTYVGRYSLIVLATHTVICRIFLPIVYGLHVPVSVAPSLLIIVTLLSYYLVIPFMKRFLPHVVGLKLVTRWRPILIAALIVVVAYLAGMYAYFEVFTPNTYPEVCYPTPNIGQGTNRVEGIVLHHTACPTLDNALTVLTDSSSQVSCHVLIDRDGTRYLLAAPEQVTWHAGWSSLHGQTGCNAFTVGIEFQGDTESWPLTRRQILSAIEYIRPIVDQYSIPVENIVTHEMVRNEWIVSQHDTACVTKCDITSREYHRFMEQYKMQCNEGK